MSARGQLKGRKVLVKLIDGTKFVDTFKDNSSRHIILEDHGRIRRDYIKKMSPYVEEGYVWQRVRDRSSFDEQSAKDFPNICPMREWAHGPGHWVPCMKALDKNGCCEQHGKVRFTVTEAARDAKERQEKMNRAWARHRRAGRVAGAP